MPYIDTHCHLNFAVYDDDLREVIHRTKDAGVSVINVGTQADTSARAVALASEYDHLWAIIGLHPIHTSASFHDHDELGEQGDEFTSRGEVFDPVFYRILAQSEKVVGIGECGFDYYRNTDKTKEAQEVAFRAQIELALELDLPLMLHIRPSEGSYDAYEDTLTLLQEYKNQHPTLRGQVHFFAGTTEIIDAFINLGFYISFTGVITFAPMYRELVAHVPLNRILSETDSPYVSPIPFRGTRNEAIHVREVVVKIAEIKGLSVEVVKDAIEMNVERLYGIKVG